ncbi:MAG: hypothetical protein HQK52_20080 [Oligoflexia bacterium]|nr:hypothetical protein [Oligoflexia bacterium]
MNDFIINLASRYRKVAISYLFSLMIAVLKHTLTSASILGELHKSQYSRLLAKHPNLAIDSLDTISKKIALEQLFTLITHKDSIMEKGLFNHQWQHNSITTNCFPIKEEV